MRVCAVGGRTRPYVRSFKERRIRLTYDVRYCADSLQCCSLAMREIHGFFATTFPFSHT